MTAGGNGEIKSTSPSGRRVQQSQGSGGLIAASGSKKGALLAPDPEEG